MDELTKDQYDELADALKAIGDILAELGTDEQRRRLIGALVILFEVNVPA